MHYTRGSLPAHSDCMRFDYLVSMQVAFLLRELLVAIVLVVCSAVFQKTVNAIQASVKLTSNAHKPEKYLTSKSYYMHFYVKKNAWSALTSSLVLASRCNKLGLFGAKTQDKI